MNDRPTAAVGHMPFEGHRTCDKWLPPLRQPTTAGNIGNFAPAYVDCRPKNALHTELAAQIICERIEREQRISRNRQLYGDGARKAAVKAWNDARGKEAR